MAHALLVALPPTRPWRLEDASAPAGVLLRPIVPGDLAAVAAVYRSTYLGTSEEMSEQEAVDTAHRRRGVGRALVESVLAATGGGVALRVDAGAREARALYASLGFREQPA